jgi:xylulokinase
VDKKGNILAHSAQSYGIITLHNQWAEQWPDVWFDAAINTISTVVSKVDPHDIAGICISALYGGSGVLCDEKMAPVRPSLIWMDRRAEEESKWIAEHIGEQEIFDVSKNGIDSYFGYTKLLWVQNHEPENWKKIKKIVPVHSYIVYKLTGKLTVDYCSAGNVGGIYDYNTHSWSEKIAEKLNIDMETLPRDFYSPSDVAGGLTEEYSEKTGLPAGVPICAGTVDCIASMLSAAIVGEGDNAAILGTSLNWGFVHHNMPSDSRLISMPYCIEPKRTSYTYGGASTAGALPRWFMTNFLQDESADAYIKFEQEIRDRKIPAGSDGLIVLPYFMGERTPIWDENATGLILGLSLAHTKAHIYKAILESAAYSLLHIMESMNESVKVSRIVLVGGGSKSVLWKSIFADVTGLPVYTPVNPVEAPQGDAFLAGIGTGLLSSFDEIKSWVTFNQPIEPDPENHRLYQEYFEIYKDLYPKLKDNMGKLRKLSFV